MDLNYERRTLQRLMNPHEAQAREAACRREASVLCLHRFTSPRHWLLQRVNLRSGAFFLIRLGVITASYKALRYIIKSSSPGRQ